jgi:hypothetical protein
MRWTQPGEEQVPGQAELVETIQVGGLAAAQISTDAEVSAPKKDKHA